MKEIEDTWLAGLTLLPERWPLYPRIKRILLGVRIPVLVHMIGAAQDVDEKMLKWSEVLEPRFISWNAAALQTFVFTFPVVWSRKNFRAIPSRKPEVCAGHGNDVYAPADVKTRLKWPRRENAVMLEVARE